MNVYVLLIVIALENNHVFVMLQNSRLPIRNIKTYKRSFDAVENILQESTQIRGRWLEARPKLLGILDEDTQTDEDGNRKVLLVYNLNLPAKNRLSDTYDWVDVDGLEGINISDVDKDIIRHSIINFWE